MFDFSPAGIVTALVLSVWASLSTVALAATGGSLALMLIRHEVRSATFRAGLLGLAAGLGLFGVLWQGAEADGARRMLQRDHALALQAERERAEASDAITRDLAEQATRDLADAQADNAKLKDLNDALSRDPRGARAAVPRDLSRRLRSL
ncbi:MAG: hypothetical protein MIL41_10285 [Hyphomicrobiales bacterium]|jgi:hypothetical protein